MAKAATEKINWTEGLVVETFGLRREFHNVPILTNWLDVQQDQLN